MMTAFVLGLALAAPPAGAPARFGKGLSRPAFGPTDHAEGPSTTKACAECHEEVAERWALSGHADAGTHFVFAVSVAREKHTETCVRCHVPAAEDVPGIGCPACHVAEGRVVGPRALDGPYPVARDPALVDEALCEGCHQFGFAVRSGGGPIVGLTEAPHLQQDTFGEWRRWRADAAEPKGCVECHFAGHTFGGKRRYEALGAALDVAYDPRAHELVLRSRGVGHAVPTGDVMRWLELEVSEASTFEPGVTRRVAAFGRKIEHRDWQDGLPPHPGVAEDHRLHPGAPVRVPVPRGGWRHWRVVYHLLPETYERAGALPAGMSARTILEGTLP